jgi:hypothetical protein
MSAHPKDDTLMDLAEGGGSPEARLHVTKCARCAERIAEARAMAELSRGVEVPEPPAFYWTTFRHNVHRRIAEERPRAAWRGWLLPLTAVSVAVALAVVMHRPPSGVRAPQIASVPGATAGPLLPAWSPLPPAEEDEGLPVLEGLAASAGVDWDEGRGLDSYLAGLSEEDSSALARALRQNGGEGVL